jgi:hypothetical protein
MQGYFKEKQMFTDHAMALLNIVQCLAMVPPFLIWSISRFAMRLSSKESVRRANPQSSSGLEYR